MISENPPDCIENPHWCKCGWIDLPRPQFWGRCASCGFLQVPQGDADDVGKLCHALIDMPIDWGPFHWHPAAVKAARSIRLNDPTWVLAPTNKYWHELFEPHVHRLLTAADSAKVAHLLATADAELRLALIREIRSCGMG